MSAKIVSFGHTINEDTKIGKKQTNIGNGVQFVGSQEKSGNAGACLSDTAGKGKGVSNTIMSQVPQTTIKFKK